MANDTATYDPATDELMTPAEAPDQSDEMLAYLAALANESRLKQTLAVNEAMKREEGPPDEWMNWPPATVQPPAPAVPPASAPPAGLTGVPGLSPLSNATGRMYLGPNIPTESVRQLVPPGHAFSTIPPAQVTAPDDGSYESRLVQAQAADKPGTRTISIARPSQRLTPTDIAWTPAYEQWAAQQDLKADIEKGMTPEQALLKHPAAVTGTGGMTRSQQANLDERKREFDERQKAAAESGTPKLSKIDDQHSLIQVAGSKKWQLIDNTTGDIKPLTPKQAADLLTKITAEEQSTRKPTALSGMKDDLADIVKSGVTGARVKKARTSPIPKAHIDFLRKNPSYAASFDREYGQGEAKKILNP